MIRYAKSLNPWEEIQNMGKFDGILLCTDLDGTLLSSDHTVSDENRKSIEYFMSEGGKFTFCTGRVKNGARLVLDYIVPNAPIVCFNGGVIYDFQNDKILYESELDKSAADVIYYVAERIDDLGVEICTNDNVYYPYNNYYTYEHAQIEHLPMIMSTPEEIEEKWNKIIFMVKEEDVLKIKKIIAESEYADKFSYIQSYKNYYEILRKDSGKGDAMLRLAEILGIDKSYTIAIGDNENDLTLVKSAGIGVAVANSVPELLDIADIITVDNNSHAVAAVIDMIDKGKIVF